MKISVSEKAQEMIKKQLKDKNKEDSLLRIFIQSMGWGGPSFGIALEGSKNEKEDYSTDINGLQIVVENDILKNFNGFTIDYSDSWLNRGFRIIPGSPSL